MDPYQCSRDCGSSFYHFCKSLKKTSISAKRPIWRQLTRFKSASTPPTFSLGVPDSLIKENACNRYNPLWMQEWGVGEPAEDVMKRSSPKLRDLMDQGVLQEDDDLVIKPEQEDDETDDYVCWVLSTFPSPFPLQKRLKYTL